MYLLSIPAWVRGCVWWHRNTEASTNTTKNSIFRRNCDRTQMLNWLWLSQTNPVLKMPFQHLSKFVKGRKQWGRLKWTHPDLLNIVVVPYTLTYPCQTGIQAGDTVMTYSLQPIGWGAKGKNTNYPFAVFLIQIISHHQQQLNKLSWRSD